MDDLFYLYDEDGNEIPFTLLDTLTRDGLQYVALLPEANAGETGSEVLIMQVLDNEELILVEDKKLNRALYEQFKEEHKDEYSFRD